jgi:hypothetical protein
VAAEAPHHVQQRGNHRRHVFIRDDEFAVGRVPDLMIFPDSVSASSKAGAVNVSSSACELKWFFGIRLNRGWFDWL